MNVVSRDSHYTLIVYFNNVTLSDSIDYKPVSFHLSFPFLSLTFFTISHSASVKSILHIYIMILSSTIMPEHPMNNTATSFFMRWMYW